MPDATSLAAGHIDTPELELAWSEAPWDSVLFGAPVLQINTLAVRSAGAGEAARPFVEARERLGTRLVSCRLPHDRLAESMLLEDLGFRFIEMLYQPSLELTGPAGPETGLTVSRATAADLPDMLDTAGAAFGNERFHMDPRLPSALGDLRYQNWVRNTLDHPSQQLFAIRDGDAQVAFFITEDLPGGVCYWHLTAVAPRLQGQGYGRRTWEAMIEHARRNGAGQVRTSIVARNHRVLNLYARLGFRFPPPQMTFHWVAAA